MKSCQNFTQQTTRSTPLDPNLMFRSISYYLGAFGRVCCVTTLSSKRAKLVQKFVPRSRVGIFHSERTRSTPLESKLMCLVCFVLFGCIWTVWLSCKTQCKTGRTGAKVRATESRHKFSHQTHPIVPIGVLNSYFGAFHTIWVHLVPFGYHTKLGAKWAEVVQNFVP